MREFKIHAVLCGISFIVVLWSAINPYGYFEWFFLGLPAILYIFIFTVTYKRFRFTTFTYIAILVQVVLLLIGAKYTSTLNPLFEFFKESLDLSRNHFDRLQHIFVGFTPFFIVKEVLLRQNYMKRSFLLYVVIHFSVIGAAAVYELLEYMVCVFGNRPADYILSFQGDMFDTQWDLIMAIVGLFIAQLLFNKAHDRAIYLIDNRKGNK